jgi:hypothetical protein
MKRAKSTSCPVFEVPDLLNLICTFLHPEEFADNRVVCRAFSRIRPRWRYLSNSGNFASRSDSHRSLDLNQMLELADLGSLCGLKSYRPPLPIRLNDCRGLRELVLDNIDTFDTLDYQDLARCLPRALLRLSLQGHLGLLQLDVLRASCPDLEELILAGALDFGVCLEGWPRLRRLDVQCWVSEMEQCLRFVSAQKQLEVLELDWSELHYFSQQFSAEQMTEFSENAPWHLLPASLRVLSYHWTPPQTLYKALDERVMFAQLILLTAWQEEVAPESRTTFVDCFGLQEFESGFPFI